MANKNRAWRPDDGFYKAIREKAGEDLSDHELVQMMAVHWLGSQSVTLPTNGEDQSVTLTEKQEDKVMELMMNALNDLQFAGEEEIKELRGGMSQLHDAMRILRAEMKVLRQDAGFI